MDHILERWRRRPTHVAEGDEERVRTFLDNGGPQRFLGIEMVVQGPLSHPRPLDDRAPCSGRIPNLTEYINRGIEDLPPSRFGSNLTRHRSCTSGVPWTCADSGSRRLVFSRQGNTSLTTSRSSGPDRPPCRSFQSESTPFEPVPIPSAVRRLTNWLK